jgi:hypothetical protein
LAASAFADNFRRFALGVDRFPDAFFLAIETNFRPNIDENQAPHNAAMREGGNEA